MICPDCSGTGTTERHLVKTFVGEPYEETQDVMVSPAVLAQDGTVIKEAEYEKQTVILTRNVEQDGWADAGPCARCAGQGLIPDA